MARTLLDLANDMDKLAVKVGGLASEASKEVARAIVTDLVLSTPADVGTAVSNWQVTLDSPSVGILGAYAPSPRGKVINGKWTHAADPATTAQANLAPTLEAAKAVLALKRPGQVIYITNNLPYIQALNDGSSEQAPAGFVDRALVISGVVVARVKI